MVSGCAGRISMISPKAKWGLQLRLELGFLLGDLLGHLLPGLVQLGGQRVVGDRQDLGGQHSCSALLMMPTVVMA